MRSWARHGFTTSIRIERRLPGSFDACGDESVVYSDSEIITQAVYAPSATDESETGERDSQSARAVLYLPLGTKVGVFDKITTFDGLRWDVDGEPNTWLNNPFTGLAGGVVVNLVRKQG